MRIEMDRKAIFAKEEIVIGDEDSKNTDTETWGRCGPDYIKLSTEIPINIIFTFIHEYGHFRGDRVSFKRKPMLGGRAVLTFDEIKATNASLNLTEKEAESLTRIYMSKRIVKPNWDHLWVADRLLRVLFKGRANYEGLRVYTYTKKEMRKDIIEHPTSSMVKKGKVIVNMNTKTERDVELPAIYTEVASLLILENTFNKYGLWNGGEDEMVQPWNTQGHQRAQNIIARAYQGKGWMIPSMVDLNRR